MGILGKVGTYGRMVVRDVDAVNRVEEEAFIVLDAERSDIRRVAYAEGVIAALEWLRGERDGNPLEDEAVVEAELV